MVVRRANLDLIDPTEATAFLFAFVREWQTAIVIEPPIVVSVGLEDRGHKRPLVIAELVDVSSLFGPFTVPENF